MRDFFFTITFLFLFSTIRGISLSLSLSLSYTLLLISNLILWFVLILFILHIFFCIWNSRLNNICKKSLIYVFLLFKIYYYYFDANANIFSFGVLISGWFFFFEIQLLANILLLFFHKFCSIVIQMFIHSCMIVEFTMYMKVSNSYVNIFVYNIWLIIFYVHH